MHSPSPIATLLHLHTPAPAAVDVLREREADLALQVLGVFGFAVLTALAAQVRVYVWEVPFTLQTLAVYGSGLYLGWRNGFLAQLTYVLLGLFFPVYAGDTFGLAYFFGAPSAGYLLAFPLAALMIGALSARWNTLSGSTLSILAGSAVVFTCGVAWLYLTTGLSLAEAVMNGWLRFLPIDILKVLSVALLYTASRQLPPLLSRR
ncbi:MAG: biotin transporter BioY [Bacteroidota bacterium]